MRRRSILGSLLALVVPAAPAAPALTFPAAPSVAAGLSTLDDFEEGWFTPVGTAQRVGYTRIGEFVHFHSTFTVKGCG